MLEKGRVGLNLRISRKTFLSVKQKSEEELALKSCFFLIIA